MKIHITNPAIMSVQDSRKWISQDSFEFEIKPNL